MKILNLDLQMANDVKIKKGFLGKNQVQGSVTKTWSKGESEAVTAS